MKISWTNTHNLFVLQNFLCKIIISKLLNCLEIYKLLMSSQSLRFFFYIMYFRCRKVRVAGKPLYLSTKLDKAGIKNLI